MPRRNNRHEAHAPLDLTPDEIPKPPKPRPIRPGERGENWADRRRREEQDRAERQRQARIKGGIDWSICLVPGCGEELKIYGMRKFHHPEDRDPEKTLPLCISHALIVWQDVQRSKHEPVIIETNETLIQRAREREAAEQAARKQRRLASQAGHIYYLRLNGLIKVGWSRDVDQRLRAYGPDVEVLAIYPGTRDDETNLHRQLRPVLARGREWYEDCKVIADYVAAAVKEHGPPVVYTGWTRPKEVIRPRRRSA